MHLQVESKKYKEAQKQYNEWLEQVDKERKEAQEEWDRWQREWSKGQAPFWLSLDGISFEVELANLYKALGYEASLTSWTGDEGVDINLKKDGKNIIVQCKAHNKPVGAPTVRELFGSMHHFQADEAILACTAGFTASAINFAKGKPIRLIKLDDILKMQASLLRNMPAPPQPRSYQSDKRPYNSSQPSANPTTYISAPTISRQQHIWSLAISSVVGIGIVSGYVLLTKIYSMPVLVPEKKIATLATTTPIPSAPIPTPSSTPQPTPSASIEEEDTADVIDPEDENSPSITLTLPSPTPIPTINQNIADISRANSNIASNQSNGNLQMPAPALPPQTLSREDERRISKAKSLRQLGVDVDWREYTWTELYDMEMRVRKAADLQRLGLNVDWRKYTWAEMYDWQQRIGKAEDLKAIGLNVDWREHTWTEMYDWQQRIRKANDLQKYGIYVDWRNYTWLQMYEMEQKARKK